MKNRKGKIKSKISFSVKSNLKFFQIQLKLIFDWIGINY